MGGTWHYGALLPIRMTNFSNTKWEYNRKNKGRYENKKLCCHKCTYQKLCCHKCTYCPLLVGNLKYTQLLPTFWLEIFMWNLRWKKQLLVTMRDSFACIGGGSWFWLMIIGTQENFVLVNVFDKSRSITSFSSFSIHKISINTLITFFFAGRQTGVLGHTHTKSLVFTSLSHCGFK